MAERGRVRAALVATPGARAALVLLGVLLLLAVAAPVVVPYPPERPLDLIALKTQPPSWAHPFGTDPYSRDVLSRVVAGTRVSLGVAGVGVLLSALLGTAVGALAGALGGWVDQVAMRVVDVALAVPRVLLVLAVVALWGALPVGALVLLLGATGWFGLARLVRNELRALSATEWATATAALGVPAGRRILVHLLPALAPTVLAHATLGLPALIGLEAALSYFGLGVQPPTPSWGNVMLDGAGQVGQFWWLTLFPALAIIVATAATHIVGDALRSAFRDGQLGRMPLATPPR
jgi:peptide/nickel transport system permease protein